MVIVRFGWSVPPIIQLCSNLIPFWGGVVWFGCCITSCPFLPRSLSCHPCCCITPQSRFAAFFDGTSLRPHLPSAFVELLLNLFFSQRHFTPPLLACLVSSRACRPWTLVPSPFPCVLSLCCYGFLFLSFFSSLTLSCYYHSTVTTIITTTTATIITACSFLFFFISSQSSLPSPSSSILDKLKK